MKNLNIPEIGKSNYDFLALGALVTRLDPGTIPFSHANHYDIHVSGGEYNVAKNLSCCFKLKTAIATAMVDNYPIGLRVQNAVREAGVTPFYVHFKNDGVRGPNIAQVWSDRGHGVRAPVVFYNRSNEAAALLKAGSFNWNEIFGKGVRWFHSGGIFCSLSETLPDLVIEAMKAAKKSGAVISFDLNYRAKLWAASGGAERAPKILRKITELVDVLVGNEEDLQLGLGIPGPEISSKTSKLDPSTFFEMMENVIKEFPNIKAVATTLRDVHSTNHHSWGAVLWLDGKSYVSPTCELDVYDRVGGGDGFASGLFYGLMSGKNPEDALRLGWAHGALLTTFPGDTSLATLENVEAFAKGGSARIQR
jgi:2-dehydro-3-deoxygluconokinase